MKRFLTVIFTALLTVLAVNSLWAAPPSTQARYIGFSNITSATAKASWINGNGVGRLVVISTDNTWETITTYANQNYSSTDGSATKQVQLGTSNDYVIGFTTGTTRLLNLTGLTSGTTYYIKVYEYNGTHGAYEFCTATGVNNPRSFTTKAADLTPPSGLAFSTWSEGGILSWTTDGTNAAGYYLTVFDNGAPVADYNNMDIGLPSTKDFWLLGLTSNKAYTYSITSYDANNNISIAATGACATSATPLFSITSYNPASGVVPIGGTVTIALTATNNQVGLVSNGITVNGVDCASSLLDNGNGTYTITYTVVEGNTDIADGSDLPLSITLKDGNSISSATATGSGNAGSAPGVDAHRPVVTTVVPTKLTNAADGDMNFTPAGTATMWKIGDAIYFAVNFGEIVTVTGTPRILLNTADGNQYANYDAISTTTLRSNLSSNNWVVFTWTATDYTSNALDLSPKGNGGVGNNAVLDLNSGSIKDANGNDATATSGYIDLHRTETDFTNLNAIDVDRVKPTVTSIVKNTPAGQNTNANSVTWKVTFSENINAASLASTDFTVSTVSGSLINGPVTIVAPVTVTASTVYDVTVNTIDGNAEIRLDFTGSVNDYNNNASTATYNSGGTYIIDNTNPTATITSPADNSYQKSITTISGTSTDAGATPNSGVADVKVAIWIDNNSNGSFDSGDYYWNGTNWITATTQTWVQATTADVWANWSYSLSIPSGDAIYYVETQTTDNAGNVKADAQGSTTHKFTIDNTAPSITTRTLSTNGNVNGSAYYAMTGQTITLTLAANEPITAPTVTIGGSAATLATGTAPTANYTYTLAVDGTPTPAADGSVAINVSGYTDRANNAGTTINTISDASTATVDRVKPTFTVGTIGTSTGLTANQFYLDFTMSEGVYTNANMTGPLTTGDFTYSFTQGALGSASTITLDAVTRTDNTNPASATALAAGDVNVRLFFHTDVAPNGIETISFAPAADQTAIYDVAGNGMLGTINSGTLYMPDKVAPTIQLVKVDGLNDGQVWKKHDSTAIITFQVVEVKAMAAADPTVTITQSDNTQIGTALTTANSHTGTGTVADPYIYTYNYSVPVGNYQNCKVKVDAIDLAGNNASQAALTPAFTIDNTAPTVTITAPTTQIYFSGDEAVSYTATDITFAPSATTQAMLTGGTLADFVSGNALSTVNGWAGLADGATATLTVSHTDKAGNIGTNTYTVIRDNTAPVQSAPAVTALTNTVVAGYYNSTNNGVQIAVTLANDATLVGGNYKIQYDVDGVGSWADVTAIATHTPILVAEINTTINSTLSDAQFTALVADGHYIQFRAVTTDEAGNTTNGVASSSITRDETAPTITPVTIASSNSNTSYAKLNDNVIITLTSNETLTASTGVSVNAITSGGSAVTDATKVVTNTTGNTWTVSYTVGTGDTDGLVAFNLTTTDLAGNTTTVNTVTNATSVTVDKTAPAAFTTGAVVTTGGNVVANYWNATNTGITVTVPLNNADASLDNGTVLVQYAVNGGSWNNLTTAHTITNGERTAGTVNISNAAFNDALFTEGATITFQAITTDIAGNATTGTASTTTLTVDQTAPTAVLVSATADNIINIAEKAAGFNAVATSTEATGTLYVVDVTTYPSPTYANIATSTVGSSASAGALTNTNIAISAGNIGIITGSTYKVYAIDAAGNLSAPSVATFTTDLVAPTITSITSVTADGTKKIGDQVVFTLTTDEAATFTANGGTAALDMALTTGSTDAVRSTDNASSTTLDLTYTVAEGDSKTDLTWTDGAISLAGGATWVDAAGNPVDLTVSGAAAFATAHAINIDGIKPTFTVEYHLGSVTGPSLGVNPVIGIGNNYFIKLVASESLQANPTISIGGTTDNNVASGSTILSDATNYVYSFNRVVNTSNTDNGVQELITVTGTDVAGNSVTAVVPTNAKPIVADASGYQAKVDGKRPTPTISFAASIDYTDSLSNIWTNANPIATTIDYGEPTQNVNSGVVSITNGSLSNFVNSANTTFTFNVAPTDAGAVTVSVPEGNNTNQIKDAGGNYAYGATSTIYYDATAPTTTDNVPSTWQTSDVTITFTPNDGSGSGVAKVYYTTNGTTPTTSSSFVTSPYQFTISTDGIYTIKYFAVDNVGNAETVKTATNTLKFDKTAPTFATCVPAYDVIINFPCFFFNPNPFDYWNDGSHNINWDSTKVSDNISDDAHTSLAFEYSLDGTTWNSIPSTGIYANASTLAWTVALPTGTQVDTAQVRVKATDEAGNVSTWYESMYFTLDNKAPTATITITPNNHHTDYFTAGDVLNGYSVNKNTTTLTIVANFSESMATGTVPTLTFNTELDNILGTPTGSGWSTTTKTNDTYTWTVSVSGTNLTKLDNTVQVGIATDLAGNVVTTDANNPKTDVKVDQVAPTLTSAHLYSNNTNNHCAKNGERVYLDVITDKNLSNIWNKVTFYSNGIFLNYVEYGWLGNNGPNSFQISIQVVSGGDPLDPSGTVTTSLTFADLAGNSVTIPANATTNGSVIIDVNKPVISNIKINSVSTGNVWLNSAGTGTITFDLTEANPTQPTVNLYQSDGTTALNVATATYSSKSYAGTPGDTTYTYTVTGLTGDYSSCQIKIDETDLAGNAANQGLLSPAFNVDNAAPTATITITPNNTPTNGYSINNATTSITIVATFDESMDQTLAPTLQFTNFGSIIGTVNSASWTDVTHYTWVYPVSNTTPITALCSLTVSAAKDLAQNVMTTLYTGDVIKVDQVLPTITWRDAYQSTTGVNPANKTDRYVKNGDVVYYEFTSSKVLPTNLAGALKLEFNGTTHLGGQNTFTPYTDGTNTVYGFYGTISNDVNTGNYKTDGDMTYLIQVADAAGNPSNSISGNSINAAANQPVIVDNTLPAITITAPSAGAYVNGTQALTWTLTETNASITTQAKIAAGTLTDATSGALINTLNGYSALADNTAGTITVSHTDLAGNVGTATVSVNKDETLPTLTITRVAPTVGDAAGFYTNADVVQFTLTFSEPVINFDVNDITLNNTGTINTPDMVLSGTGPYTVTVGGSTAITGDGTIGITVNKAAFTDRASNQMANDVTSSTFTIDNTAPTISNFTIPCDPTYQNNIGDIDFSELVYTDAKAGTPLTTGDFSVSSSGGFATLQSWSYNSTTTFNLGTQTRVLINLVWSALRNGSELVSADVFNSTSVYDRAGNALVAGSPKSGNPPVPVSNIQNPSNASTCETGTATFTSSGIGVATMQWQVSSDNVSFTDVTNGGVYSGATTGTLTITNPTATYNGLYYKIKYHTNCDDFYSASAQLTVNPNTFIQTQPSNVTVCQGSVNNNLTVTAGGQAPVGYQWQYSADGINSWANVSSGTPTNATYTGGTSATLNVTGNIAAGTYYYKVIVNSACGANVTSNNATLTVNPLPNDKTVSVTDATVCYGNSTTAVVETTDVNVDYQLRNGTTAVGSAVAGTGNNISLSTGNLTATTTFNVLAINHTTGCSIQLTNAPTVTVEATPVNPTLATATPTTGSTVCQGSSVNATFTAGSGGNGTDSYQYSLDNGSTYSAYTAGTNLTAETQTIIIQGKRNATVCATTWTTLATWNVEATPVAPTLTKDPNTASVCSGTTVRATWADFGSGGNGNYAFDYRKSTDGGTNWTSWAMYGYIQDGSYYYGYDISTTGLTNVEIRATRNATYCTAATNTVSWTVNPLPTASISGTTPACQSTVLTATTNATSAAYQWYFNASSIGGATTSTYTATQSGTYKVTVTDGITSCSNTSSDFAVTIDAMPTQYNVTGGPFCAGTNITIGLSNSQNGYTYWLYKDASSTGTSQTGNGSALTFNLTSAAAGSYTIAATNGTCQSAMNGSVTVNPAPTAYAGADASTCGTSAYQITSATATNYSSVSWSSNGLGSITNGNTLTPTYTPVAGDIGHDVTLTLTVTALAGCTNTADQMVLTVVAPATANAGSDAAICEGGTFTVSTASATNYTSLSWSRNGTGQITNNTTLTPTYIPGVGETGTVTLTLAANGQNGCNATDNMVLTINTKPTATITPSGATTFCQGGSVNLTASAGSSYLWSPGGAITQSINVTTSGSYTVVVTNANGCTNTSSATAVTVNPLPTTTITGNNTVAINTNLNLSTVNAMSSYSWSATGTPTITNATSQTATFNWTNAGNYVVTVNFTDGNGCSNSTTLNVSVTASSAPVITGNPSNATSCSNITAQFAVTSVSGTPAPTLQWQVSTDNGSSWTDITGGDYTGVNSATLNVSNLTGKNSYQYKLHAYNGINPDAYSTAATLTVTPAETPSVSIAQTVGSNPTCSGSSVTFTATPSNIGGGTVSYDWKKNGTTLGAANQNTYTSTTLTNGDVISCTITITNGCVTTTTASPTNDITMIVNTVPAQPSAITGNTTVCAGTTGVAYSVTNVSGVTYTWLYGGANATINGSGNSITIDFASGATSGTLTVTPHNGCGDGTAQTLAITIPSAISYANQPSNATATVGGNVSFSATVNNAISYQWQVSTDNGVSWANATGGVYSNGTTTTLNITGAAYSMNGYQYKLLSSSSCETNIASNIVTLTVMADEPTTQASNIQWLGFGSNWVKIGWTNGNGSARVVLAKNATSCTEVLTDGTAYTGNTTFGSGTQVGSAYTVYNSNLDTVSIYGLTYNQYYTFKIFEYNGTGSSTNYLTSGFVANSNPKSRKINGKTADGEISVMIGEHFLLTAISPNPVTNEVNFDIVSKEELPFTIEVYTTNGDLVYSMTKKLSAGDYPMNLKLGSEKGGASAGAYFLKVTAGGETLQQKFIYQP